MEKSTTLREEFESETRAHAFADQQYIKWLEKMVQEQRELLKEILGLTAGVSDSPVISDDLSMGAAITKEKAAEFWANYFNTDKQEGLDCHHMTIDCMVKFAELWRPRVEFDFTDK